MPAAAAFLIEQRLNRLEQVRQADLMRDLVFHQATLRSQVSEA
jgi:hypothetical protein